MSLATIKVSQAPPNLRRIRTELLELRICECLFSMEVDIRAGISPPTGKTALIAYYYLKVHLLGHTQFKFCAILIENHGATASQSCHCFARDSGELLIFAK